MIWQEVEKKYGKKMADKMNKSRYLKGITVTMTNDGKVNIPERDIEAAYADVKGKRIHPLLWD